MGLISPTGLPQNTISPSNMSIFFQANIDNLIERMSDLSNNYNRIFSKCGINDKTEWFIYERILEYLQPVLPYKKTKTISNKKYQAVDKQQHKVYD